MLARDLVEPPLSRLIGHGDSAPGSLSRVRDRTIGRLRPCWAQLRTLNRDKLTSDRKSPRPRYRHVRVTAARGYAPCPAAPVPAEPLVAFAPPPPLPCPGAAPPANGRTTASRRTASGAASADCASADRAFICLQAFIQLCRYFRSAISIFSSQTRILSPEPSRRVAHKCLKKFAIADHELGCATTEAMQAPSGTEIRRPASPR